MVSFFQHYIDAAMYQMCLVVDFCFCDSSKTRGSVKACRLAQVLVSKSWCFISLMNGQASDLASSRCWVDLNLASCASIAIDGRDEASAFQNSDNLLHRRYLHAMSRLLESVHGILCILSGGRFWIFLLDPVARGSSRSNAVNFHSITRRRRNFRDVSKLLQVQVEKTCKNCFV